MATRKKTVKIPFNFGNVTDIADNVLTSIGTQSLYILENSATYPITFSSVMLFVAAQDNTTTAASLNTFRTDVLVNGVSSSVTLSGSLTNTGENWGGLFGPIDFTGHFNSNFGTATSRSCGVKVLIDLSVAGATSRGVYSYLEATYQYSDLATARTQTICVPHESPNTTLTTTANSHFSTMPQLTGATGWINGYNNPIVYYRWLEIKGNCNNLATSTNHNLSYRFDTGSTVTLPTRVSALSSDTYQIYLVDGSGVSTTATHSFQLWNSLAYRWPGIVVDEWVTFGFTVSGVTQVLNYIEAPIEFDSPIAGTTNTVSHRNTRRILISEPDTIVTRNCAVELFYNNTSATTPNLSIGSQSSYRAYGVTISTSCGVYSFQQRFDAGSVNGVGATLSRGVNNIDVNLYRSVGAMSNVTGIMKILYSSGVASSGIDNHTQTRYGYIRQLSFTGTTDDTVTDSFSIPEDNYWLTSVGLQYFVWPTVSSLMTMMVQARLATGEGDGDGWRELFGDSYLGANELSYSTWIVRARDEFKIHPNDMDTDLMNIETSRSYRTAMSTSTPYGSRWIVCYNTLVFPISGTIYGSNGSTVSIYVENESTGLIMDTFSIVGGGTYSLDVHDDTVTYIVEAYESTTRKGLSKEGYPGTGFDINLIENQTYGFGGG